MSRVNFINLENETLEGNVLDIGFNNYGIAYSLFKNNSDEISVDYLEGKMEKNKIEKNYYDSCIIFFSLSCFCRNYYKNKLLREISENLKATGSLYIWDTDKPLGKIFVSKLKIILPGKISKDISIQNYKFFIDASYKKTKKLIEKYFEIIDYKYSDNIYCIKASSKKKTSLKREKEKNENIVGSS